MVFLRSEEHRERWLAGLGREPGADLSAPRLHELAVAWWSSRLAADWRPRSAAESQAILDRLGFTGAFWQLA